MNDILQSPTLSLDEETAERSGSNGCVLLPSKASMAESPLLRRRSDQNMRKMKQESIVTTKRRSASVSPVLEQESHQSTLRMMTSANKRRSSSSIIERQTTSDSKVQGSASPPIPRRRSDQGLRATKRDGFVLKRSSSLRREQTTVPVGDSPEPTPINVRHLGISPSMHKAVRKQATNLKEYVDQTASSSSPQTKSCRVPTRKITKSSSLNMPRQTYSQSNASRKQVNRRSVSFSGRSSIIVPASPGMNPRKMGSGSLSVKKSDRTQLRRRMQNQNMPVESDSDNGDEEPNNVLVFLASTTSKTQAQQESKSRKVQFYDKVRYKSIAHSRINSDEIWYSKVEIMMHRRREQDAKRQSRPCHNATLLNVEGLFTEKEQRLMMQRRTESREAVFDIQEANRKQRQHEAASSFGEGKHLQALNDDYDQHEAMAKEYERLSAPAIQSAHRRGTLLALHVNLLSDLSFLYSDDDDDDDEEDEGKADEASVDMKRPLLSPVIRKASVKSWLGSGSWSDLKRQSPQSKFLVNRKVLG